MSNTQKAEELESEESEILGDIPRRPFAFIVKAITTSLHSRSVLGRVIVESLTKSFN